MPTQKKFPQLSLFLPVYNEAAIIADTVSKADKVLRQVADQYEILCINDGSRDQSEAIIKKLMTKNKSIRLHTHHPNRGYGGAIKSGFNLSRFPWVSFIDSDGQFDYAEIKKFLPFTAKFDFIIGYRLNRHDPLHRKLNAHVWKLWVWLLFGLWVKDIDCAFKLISKSALNRISLTTESALTSAELLIRAQQLGYQFKQIGVHHYPRTQGQQTGANIKVILRAFKESFKLWYQLNFLE